MKKIKGNQDNVKKKKDKKQKKNEENKRVFIRVYVAFVFVSVLF